MRCKNCGWPNKPEEKNCVKCNSPLQGGEPEEIIVPAADERDVNLRMTVSENDIFGGVAQGASSGESFIGSTEEETEPCRKCGYPVRAGKERCPNCNYPMTPDNTRKQPDHRNDSETDSRSRATRFAPGGDKQAPARGTINPYLMNNNQPEPEPKFSLKPVRKFDERTELPDREFEGEEIILTRSNTEPENPSITSREQAIISKADGKWFIEDRSDLGTTFVRAAGKIELHDGDIILLGDRLFEFHE